MLAILLLQTAAAAPQPSPSPSPRPFSNETELSVVMTGGNSDTRTIGLKETFVRRFEHARFQLKAEALRADTSDDWFELVDPGFTWEPGEDPPPATSTLVKPEKELDAENYFIEGRYDRNVRQDFFTWHVGASWDRNFDAGITSRTILFGGLGNVWYKRDDLMFNTSYGLSYTDRREETADPEKDRKFAGVRLAWYYLNKFGRSTTYTNDWTNNISIKDLNDFSSDMTNALSVSMSTHLSIRVSLRWLYNHEPALEDVDSNVVLVQALAVLGGDLEIAPLFFWR
jgi:hypothetical protein